MTRPLSHHTRVSVVGIAIDIHRGLRKDNGPGRAYRVCGAVESSIIGRQQRRRNAQHARLARDSSAKAEITGDASVSVRARSTARLPGGGSGAA